MTVDTHYARHFPRASKCAIDLISYIFVQYSEADQFRTGDRQAEAAEDASNNS